MINYGDLKNSRDCTYESNGVNMNNIGSLLDNEAVGNGSLSTQGTIRHNGRTQPHKILTPPSSFKVRTIVDCLYIPKQSVS